MRSAGQSRALVANWFDVQSPPVAAVALALCAEVRQAAPELSETVKWGNLVYLLDGAAVLAIAPHKSHVNLQVFNAGQLPDVGVRLEGVGRTRSLHCRLNPPIDREAVHRLVSASAALARELAAARPPRGTLPDPADPAGPA